MPINPNRALTRSNHQAVVGGVCSGIAEHIGWAPTNVRVVFLLLTLLFAGFPGVLIYLILWAVLPKK